MKQALRLARRGRGRTSPNPMVGAVIVRDGRITGQGYHRRFGGKHAEINAIEDAGGNVSGATMYVTLEPCAHYGKTPPCTDAIIRHKIKRVVIGMADPNPLVSGKGIEILRGQGITTVTGVLETECRALNEAYIKHITTGLPLVTVKYAQTLDGRIATSTGKSQWLSSPESRRLAHRLRASHDAVLVGSGTLLADDPELTVRLARGENPARIVLDSGLNIPPQAKLLTGQAKAPTMIATTPRADESKLKSLREAGIETLVCDEDTAGRVDLRDLLQKLGRHGISSLLVEGGATVITSLLSLNLADRLVVITAPMIMGRGIEAVGELGVTEVDRTLKLDFKKTYRSGTDLIIEASIRRG